MSSIEEQIISETTTGARTKWLAKKVSFGFNVHTYKPRKHGHLKKPKVSMSDTYGTPTRSDMSRTCENMCPIFTFLFFTLGDTRGERAG